ncbi:MAG TPA: ATP-binding protein [Steroidobacteraceae bacterium]
MKKANFSVVGAGADVLGDTSFEDRGPVRSTRPFSSAPGKIPRRRLEAFLLSLSGAFARGATPDLEQPIERWLEKFARLIDVDRVTVWERLDGTEVVHCRSAYSRQGTSEPLLSLPSGTFPWLMGEYERGRPIVWQRIPEDIPDTAEAERQWALRVGAKSALGIPMRFGSSLWVLAFTTCTRHAAWSAGRLRCLRLAGEIVLAALVRQRAESAWRFNEAERREAQAEIERLQLELTHVERVNLMGHLTASLAHQLLQPITAILSNAEAGYRVLDSKSADRQALRAILQDIEFCSQNAAAVIRGVTDLLHKEPRPFKRLNLNAVVQDVIDVMRSDFILRHVRLVCRLDAVRTDVIGDAVQLQQAVLNLVLNALEAMSECHPEERTLVVTTTDGEGEVELRVCDRGAGVDPRHLEDMFRPFFTTKKNGMGMGLHICSEIIRAHGGSLCAKNNVESPGLTVRCSLPLE